MPSLREYAQIKITVWVNVGEVIKGLEIKKYPASPLVRSRKECDILLKPNDKFKNYNKKLIILLEAIKSK